MVYAGQDVFRRTCLDSGLKNDVHCCLRAFGGTRMRGKDSAVAGLQADKRLEDGRGGRVGGGNDAGHHAQWRRYFAVAVNRVIRDDAAGGHILIFVVDVFGSEVVLDDLVFHDAHAGFLDGQAGQLDAAGCCRGCGMVEDIVHLLLGVGGKDALSGNNALNHGIQLFAF